MKETKSQINKLTGREREICNLMAAGLISRDIAGELNISLYTVKAHRRNIYKKLQCKNLITFMRIMDHNNGTGK